MDIIIKFNKLTNDWHVLTTYTNVQSKQRRFVICIKGWNSIANKKASHEIGIILL